MPKKEKSKTKKIMSNVLSVAIIGLAGIIPYDCTIGLYRGYKGRKNAEPMEVYMQDINHDGLGDIIVKQGSGYKIPYIAVEKKGKVKYISAMEISESEQEKDESFYESLIERVNSQ